MWIADKETVKALTNEELCGLWIIDSAKVSFYREEAKSRSNNGDGSWKKVIEAAKRRLYQELDQPKPIQLPSDIDPLITAAMINHTESYVNLCQAIKNSKWDRIDPKGKMRKTPVEVDDFLDDMMRWGKWHKSQDLATQNLMTMICDSYIRWRRRT